MSGEPATLIAPAMTREEWEKLPAEVKRFLPWERAQLPAVIILPDPAAVDAAVAYFTQADS